MLQLLILLAAGIGGFLLARTFVRRRLRFVDAVHAPFAPLVAGVVAAALAWPLAMLPAVTTLTAVTFGIGTALGTASGASLLRRGDQAHRRLTP
jgi:hypothetical protein